MKYKSVGENQYSYDIADIPLVFNIKTHCVMTSKNNAIRSNIMQYLSSKNSTLKADFAFYAALKLIKKVFNSTLLQILATMLSGTEKNVFA